MPGATSYQATTAAYTFGVWSRTSSATGSASGNTPGHVQAHAALMPPEKADNGRTVDDFRKDCLRELQKIKRAWPDLHYQTVKGALVLSPSPPAVAPSQLRLVE